ncbi:MAG: DUF72 domain-containing protein [Planctomycetota bacterium]|jgi:uncharacterized protein YecE (DUF72 family)
MEVRIGTSGFCVEPRTYEQQFSMVEVQDTLRRMPSLATVRKWRAEAPESFEFVIRAPAAITHPPRRRSAGGPRGDDVGGFRDTPGVRRAWKAVLEVAHALESRLIIFQTPAAFRPTDEHAADLFRFFQWAHRGRLRLGWEPLGGRWPHPRVRELCRELSLTHVVDPLDRASLRPRPACYRLRGVGGHRNRLTDEQLLALRDRCTTSPTYCIFSNATMREDAARFRELVAGTSGPGIDPTPP